MRLPISAALSAFLFLIGLVLLCLSFFLPFRLQQNRTIYSWTPPSLRFDADYHVFVDRGVFYWHRIVTTYPKRGLDTGLALDDKTIRTTGFIQIHPLHPTFGGFSWFHDQTPHLVELSNSERQISFPLWPLAVTAVLPVRWLMLHLRRKRNRVQGTVLTCSGATIPCYGAWQCNLRCGRLPVGWSAAGTVEGCRLGGERAFISQSGNGQAVLEECRRGGDALWRQLMNPYRRKDAKSETFAVLALVAIWTLLLAWSALSLPTETAMQARMQPVPDVAAKRDCLLLNGIPVQNVVGDGAHDDTVGIQSALSMAQKTGGLVAFAPGSTFLISKCLKLADASNVILQGQGSMLKMASRVTTSYGDGTCLLVKGCRNLTIRDLRFDGNRSHRVGFSSAVQTLWIQESSDVLVENCRFLGSICDDIYIGSVSPSSVDHACRDVRITGCTFDSPGRNGISLVSACWCRVDHNTFRNARGNDPKAGVDVEPNRGDPSGISHHITIEGNYSFGNQYGFAVNNASAGTHHVTIEGNTVSDCRYGIASEASQTFILKNEVDGCSGGGIAIHDSDLGVIAGNVVDNPAGPFAIYADTKGIATPIGHVIANNSVRGPIAGCAAPSVKQGNLSR